MKYNIDSRYFIKTFHKQTIASRLVLGYIQTNETDENVLNSQWYRVGGGDSVRGYHDQYPVAYGNKQILASVEYRFLFSDLFSMVFFLDAGYAPNAIDNQQNIRSGLSWWDNNNYRVGKGVGVRFTIPGIGPLRVDAGINDDGGILFHYSLGNAF